jgi:MFS family permease
MSKNRLETTGAPPAPNARDAAERWSRVAVLMSCLGVGLLFGFQPPLVALVLERMGHSGFTIGSVTSASTVAVILIGPHYPRLIERFGLRRSIVGGNLLAALLLLLMPALSGIPAWLCLRFLSGVALGLTWIASEIWLNRLASDRNRGTVMAVYSTVFAVGVFAGPLLLQITGTVGIRPFIVGAVGSVLAVLPVLLVAHVPAIEPAPVAPRGFAALLVAAPAVMLAGFVAGLVESADISLLPLLGLQGGESERTALLLVTVFLAGNVVMQLPIGRLADRAGRRGVLGACAVVSVVGPLLLPPAMHLPLLLWPLLFVWGGTMYGFYTQGIALVGDVFATHELAAANTVFVMAYCAGGVLGPGIGGITLDAWGANGLVAFVSAAALLLLMQLAHDARRARRPQRAS